MTNKRIYLCLAHMSGNEQRYIQEAFDTNWVVPLGPNVNAFEQEMEEWLKATPPQPSPTGEGAEKSPSTDDSIDKTNNTTPSPVGEGRGGVLALSAGTAAVHLGLLLAGVEPGDEVMVQSFTFAASCNPVRYLGATPVLVDSEPDTWNMDPDLLDRAIADRIEKTGRKPKAIVPVHLYGMPARMDRIMAVADKYGIAVVEDAAEALGSRYQGRMCGTFGRFGVLSFNGNKMITTSGGGALVCPSAEAKQRAMYFATQARQPQPYYQHTEIGYNYRMSNICAGIGRGQMTVLDQHIAHHRHVQSMYEQLLADVPGVAVHSQPATGEYDANYWLCTITLSENSEYSEFSEFSENSDNVENPANIAPAPRVEALRQWLDQRGIESRPLWKPMHLQPVYADAPAYVNGVSERLFRTGLCLPAGPCVSDDDVRLIAQSIKEFMEKCR